MNGGTRTLDGDSFPARPVNSAWVAIGVSSPAPPCWDSGEALVLVRLVVVLVESSPVEEAEGAVSVVVTGGADWVATVVDAAFFPPPPQPARAVSATTP